MSSRLLALASRASTIGIVGSALVTFVDRKAVAQQSPAAPAGSAPAVAAPSAEIPQAPVTGAVPGAPVPADAVAPVAQAPAAPVDGVAPAAQGLAPAADGLAPAAQGVTQAAPIAAGAPPPTGASVEAIAHAADHSLLGLVTQAGPVVQGVMAALVLASIICWAIMIEKGILIGRLQREVKSLSNTGDATLANGEGLAARMQRAAAREWADGRDHDESRGEYRERIERAMRETLSGTLRRAQHGTAFLATTGAVGPFVGLFGTVWGIMGSFQGIAQSRDTSLAVVAPGIAEALLATAIGLFAAIPAVIGYNRIARRVAGLRADALAAIAATGARLSGRPPRGGNLARAAE